MKTLRRLFVVLVLAIMAVGCTPMQAALIGGAVGAGVGVVATSRAPGYYPPPPPVVYSPPPVVYSPPYYYRHYYNPYRYRGYGWGWRHRYYGRW